MTAGQIEKARFVNQSDGWVGAVVLGPDGKERGVPVEPGGHVWLSEAEQRLTANAPRNDADNPFVEQTRVRRHHLTGELEEYKVAPLVMADDDRYVPANERPIPGLLNSPARMGAFAGVAATGDQPVTYTQAAGNPVLAREEEIRQADEVFPGARATSPVAARQAAFADDADPVSEETAAQVDPQVGEETGAAPPPSGEPPEGSYTAQEEVGTPTTPTPTRRPAYTGPGPGPTET